MQPLTMFAIRSGFAGESCLLRLICEINAAELGELNGVLGSLMHVLFRWATTQSLDQLYQLSILQSQHLGAGAAATAFLSGGTWWLA